MITVRNLSHSLGRKLVLKDVNLTVQDSSIVGLVGVNGAGKSTLLRLLSGVYRPDEGSVSYDGASPSDPNTRRDIFLLPDDPYYDNHTTPKTLFTFYKTFYPAIDYSVFSDLLSAYEIDLSGHLRNFSKGMRRQTFIALSLAVKPKYLLLDEAFDGLDPLSRKIFKDAIISLVEDAGTTVLISSHSLKELEDFCDRFILIDNNTVKCEGDIAEHVEKLCKFELAFSEAKTREIFSHLPIVSLTLRGKFAVIVLQGNAQEMQEKLLALSPLVMEEMPIDFEEAFIYDVEKKKGGSV